jgi:Formyl transferase
VWGFVHLRNPEIVPDIITLLFGGGGLILGALNFHPSPPKYRGVGSYWWALHNGDANFGVTCHFMDERIDHGPIIATRAFPIWPGETEASLRHRSAIYSLALLNETLNVILSGTLLAPYDAKWEQHLYTYKELAQAQSASAANNRYDTPPTNRPLDARPAFDALEAVTKEDLAMESEHVEEYTMANN